MLRCDTTGPLPFHSVFWRGVITVALKSNQPTQYSCTQVTTHCNPCKLAKLAHSKQLYTTQCSMLLMQVKATCGVCIPMTPDVLVSNLLRCNV